MFHNIPTIIFYDKEYWRNNKDSQNDFKLLNDAGILFYDPINAAKNKLYF